MRHGWTKHVVDVLPLKTVARRLRRSDTIPRTRLHVAMLRLLTGDFFCCTDSPRTDRQSEDSGDPVIIPVVGEKKIAGSQQPASTALDVQAEVLPFDEGLRGSSECEDTDAQPDYNPNPADCTGDDTEPSKDAADLDNAEQQGAEDEELIPVYGRKGARASEFRRKASAEDVASILAFIHKVSLFKRMPEDQRTLLAHHCMARVWDEDEVIIQQGEIGSEFFLLRTGSAKVEVVREGGSEAVTVATLKAGDYFGEISLLRDEPRTATITAIEPCVTFGITRETFRELQLDGKLQFTARKAVGGGSKVPPPSAKIRATTRPKTAEESAFIQDALKQNSNLQLMCSMQPEHLKQLAEVAWKKSVPKGHQVITQGDLDANFFYIVETGKFEILVKPAAPVANMDTDGRRMCSKSGSVPSREGSLSSERSSLSLDPVVVGAITKGGSFGELALLYMAPRAATIRSLQASTVWVIDRVNFKGILVKSVETKHMEYAAHLSKAAVLQCLLPEERAALAKALQEGIVLKRNESLLSEGDSPTSFYILLRGKVIIQTSEGKGRLVKADYKQKGELVFLCERVLLRREVRETSMQVVSDTAELLAVDRDTFEMLLGPLPEIIRQTNDQGSGGKKRVPFSAKGVSRTARLAKGQEKTYIPFQELKRMGLLGSGGFGIVELVEHEKSGEIYALKGLSKGHIVQTGMQESVMHERNLMLMFNSAFVVRLFEAYNENQFLYLLMEPALGGELYATYMRKGLHGNASLCRYYTAGVVYAIDHMHEKKVIYRDLKPENILITETGAPKLTDMGLAVVALGKSYTTCGTPDYFAPEMIKSAGHTRAVDWWTLGILIFELMTGEPPFMADTPLATYARVNKGISKVQFPAVCDGLVTHIIKALLRQQPNDRLAMRPGGSKNIKKHKWYTSNSFDWQAMRDGKMDPPYKPVVKDKKDMTNFSCNPDDTPPVVDYVSDGSSWDAGFATVAT
eukprot:TRINITY_DN2183_c0_g1_i1.p1 TRINITY_DN2183_c0_g1~~TRINITY_DN2183_c0_g1_i1.p1  ORF type:complete len:972 (+),score=223.73 TRINITY_DN2183_c0_g1_i1:116-3031(+)